MRKKVTGATLCVGQTIDFIGFTVYGDSTTKNLSKGITVKWNLKWDFESGGKLQSYTEIRAQENQFANISMLNGEVVTNNTTQASGISARTFVDGAWGFSSHPEISDSNLAVVVKSSFKNAKDLKNFQHFSSSHFSKIPGAHGEQNLSTKKEILSAAQRIDYLKNINDLILKRYPKIHNRSLTIREQTFIKEIINSESAKTFDHFCRSYIYVTLSMQGNHGPVSLLKVFGGYGEFEDQIPSEEIFNSEIEKIYQHLLNKSQGVHAQAGIKDVILDSKMAGILAHEAVGHTVEADIVKGGSIARENMGLEVASPLITMMDYAHTAFGKTCPSPVYFDDEGTPAEDTILIKEGVLKSFMHSKETAAEFGVKPTGHARAWGFNDEPLIRMRNTAILPGSQNLEEMIASIDDGYFLMDHSNGQADSTSEFMFGVIQGYEIKKGKLGKAILDTTISGVAFDMLKTVDMVSNEMNWVGAGTCGKKQAMHVGMGGPAIKCKLNIGGK